MFTVTGANRMVRRVASITRDDDGWLTGDRDAVEAFIRYAAANEGRWVGPPTGPGGTRDHLSDPFRVWWMMRLIFDDGATYSGDVPTLPDVPPGATP